MADEKTVVMIAMDKSEASMKAFNWYVDSFHKPKTEVIILSVGEFHNFYGNETAELMKEAINRTKQELQQFEHQLVQLMKNHHIGGKVKVIVGGKAGEVIVETAHREKATFVIMGTRGMGTIRRTIMGSVSDYVLHHLHCPLLVYRD